MRVIPVEETKKRLEKAGDLVSQCRTKAYLLETQVSNFVQHDGIEVDDVLLWLMAVEQICQEIGLKLEEAEHSLRYDWENVDLYSIDPQKVDALRKQLDSIGYKRTNRQEVPAADQPA